MSAALKLRKKPCVQSARIFERQVLVGDPFEIIAYLFKLKRTGKISINVLQGNAASVEWETHSSVD